MDKTYFDEMKAKIAQFKREMKEHGEKFFLEQSKELFAELTNVEGFGWTQYTPYYNDGDTCVFSANFDYPTIKFVGQEEIEEDDWFPNSDMSPEAESSRKIAKFLNQFDYEDVEMMFGDHCKVWVTPSKVEVEEYEHD